MGENDSNSNVEVKPIKLSTILKDLMAKERRAHILTIVIIAPLLYILGQSNVLNPNLSAMAFISLMFGYSITALIAINEKTRHYIEKTNESNEDEEDTLTKKIITNVISTLKIIFIPLFISGMIFLFIFNLMGENKPLSNVGDFLPILLSCLFIFWSVSQATSYKGSVGEWIGNKIEKDKSETSFDLKKNSLIQMGIVGLIVGIISSLMLTLLGNDDGLNGPNGTPIVVLIVLLSQGFILWYSRDIREELMKRNDG